MNKFQCSIETRKFGILNYKKKRVVLCCKMKGFISPFTFDFKFQMFRLDAIMFSVNGWEAKHTNALITTLFCSVTETSLLYSRTFRAVETELTY